MVVYVEPSLSGYMLLFGFLIVLGLAGAVSMGLSSIWGMKTKRGRNAAFVLAGATVLLTLAAVVLGGLISASGEAAKNQMLSEAKVLYPSIPGEAIDVLFEGFNARFPPEDGFEILSTRSLPVEDNGDEFVVQEVSLVWNEGKLFLATTADGETFVPLEH